MGKSPGLEVNYVSKVRATVAGGEADAQMCMRQVETAEAKGVPMSAPGADPLAAIRQRYVSRSQVRRLTTLDAGRVHDDICDLLKQWDTRESALRALVAQWRENAEAAVETGYYARMDTSETYDKCADALERLLSGPQP